MSEKFFVYTDGGARGNPGPAGIGVVIFDASQRQVCKIHKFIGHATNNQAEYQAVIEALSEIKKFAKDKELELHFKLDSELIVEQLNQRYKIKDQNLKELFWQVRDLVMALGGRVQFEHIRREQNHHADKLVNLAIDEGQNV